MTTTTMTTTQAFSCPDLTATLLAAQTEGKPACELLLDASAMNLPTDWRQRFGTALHKAHVAMTALEAGAIANPDEGRMVGHYWLRDPKRAPSRELTDAIVACQQQVHDFSRAVHAGRIVSSTGQRFDKLLVVGIGGSALGPQLAAAALTGPADQMRLFFFDNTDPDGMDRTLQAIAGTSAGLAGTLVLVVSKSGGTKETRNGSCTRRQR
jgi:glucose-6-phosphate isomerase